MHRIGMMLAVVVFASLSASAEEAKPEAKEVTLAGKLIPATKEAKVGVLAVLVVAIKGEAEKVRKYNVLAEGGVADLVSKVLKDVEGKEALVTIVGTVKESDLTVTKQIKVMESSLQAVPREDKREAEK